MQHHGEVTLKRSHSVRLQGNGPGLARFMFRRPGHLGVFPLMARRDRDAASRTPTGAVAAFRWERGLVGLLDSLAAGLSLSEWARRWHIAVIALLGMIRLAPVASGHEVALVRHGLLHEFAGDIAPDPAAPRLKLYLVDQDGEARSARFEMRVDGGSFDPTTLGTHGFRFITEHTGKRQRLQVNYARGSGPLEIGLPAGCRRVEIHAVCGLEYRPAATTVAIAGQITEARIVLRRWIDPAARGWCATDEHLHYERIDRNDNGNWLSMLEADGLRCGHFLVLKRKGDADNTARQYAYGPDGTVQQGVRLIVPGEEFRDNDQGHINLLGIRQVIGPVLNETSNWPANHDVLVQAHSQGAIGGVAHGSALGAHSTAIVDAVLGAAEFWEIANVHIYNLDRWYQLMNCGFNLPPAAGTDLPNFPFRDPWQPFLGAARMYVRTGAARGAVAWQDALRHGKVFVTTGPFIQFTVNGEEAGGTVRLPADGGEVVVEAELSTPLVAQNLELIQNGRPVTGAIRIWEEDGIRHRKISVRLTVKQSCWLAARGVGARMEVMARDSVAHTAAVRVLVGDGPIRSAMDASALIEAARVEREYYRQDGIYDRPEQRAHVLQLFDRAVAELQSRGAGTLSPSP